MSKENRYKELLNKLDEFCLRLDNYAPKIVDPASVSTIAKAPFKALSIREITYQRNLELAHSARILFKNKQYLSAFIISRSVIETTAITVYLYFLLKKSTDNFDLKAVDEELMKLLLGGRRNFTSLQSTNIVTIIDKINKKVPVVREMYDMLSEYTHPNWSGCQGAFGRIDKENVLLKLGPSSDFLNPMIGIPVLIATLELFEHYYNKIPDVLKIFSQLCENAIEKTTTE